MNDTFWITLEIERPNGVTLGTGLDAEVRVCWTGNDYEYEIHVDGYDKDGKTVRYLLDAADPLYPTALRTIRDKHRFELGDAERAAHAGAVNRERAMARAAE